MTIFLKSVLSLPMLLSAVYGMFAMYAVFGRAPDADLAASRKRRHRAAGYVFVILFMTMSYLCVAFTITARTEPSPHAALHILLTLAIAALLLVKALFLRQFHRFCEQAKIIGTLIGGLSLALVGISDGYVLVVGRRGQERNMVRSTGYELCGPFLVVNIREARSTTFAAEGIAKGHKQRSPRNACDER